MNKRQPVFKLGRYVQRGVIEAAERKPPLYLLDALEMKSGDVYAILDVFETTVRNLTELIYEIVLNVKQRFDDEEVTLLIEEVSCNRKCGVCLGRYRLHFPQLLIQGKKKPQKQIKIRTQDLRDFLKDYLNDDEINDLFYLIDLRHRFVAFVNYFTLDMQNIGLIDELIEWNEKVIK